MQNVFEFQIIPKEISKKFLCSRIVTGYGSPSLAV